MLKMKGACERCARSLPADAASAHICSFECTFCDACATEMKRVCPNCQGELVRRPPRTRSVTSVAASQVAQRMKRLVGRA